MVTALLVISLFNLSVETGQNVGVVVHAAQAVHHHFTRPIYNHTIRKVVHHDQKIRP